MSASTVKTHAIASQINDFTSTHNAYLRHCKVESANNHRITLHYEFLPYDSIDDDLDFDEFQYDKMCAHFKRWLHSLLLQIVQEHGCEIESNEIDTDETIHYATDPTRPHHLKVTRQTWIRKTI